MSTRVEGDDIICTWEVGDNYVGGKRPQRSEFSLEALREMFKDGDFKTKEELRDIIYEEIFAEFQETAYLNFDENYAVEKIAEYIPELND